jgi:hypothetical protein
MFFSLLTPHFLLFTELFFLCGEKMNPKLSRLYSRYLSSAEKISLRHVPHDDATGEINLLRVLNSLLLKFQQSSPLDLHSRMQTLRTCVILNEQLALLVRAYDRARGSHPLGDLLEEALAGVPLYSPDPDPQPKEYYAP